MSFEHNALKRTQRHRMSELDQYDYHLPKQLIAQEPLACRSDSRLLVADRLTDSITDAHFRDLLEYLRPNDCLVFNDTRVIPAQLVGKRTQTGGRWQGLFLESGEHRIGRLLCKTRGKVSPGETITLEDRMGRSHCELTLVAKLNGGSWAVRPTDEEKTWDDVLREFGRIPLPHYIRDGNMTDADVANYQTVYARKPGAVAAPTAGLHFTKELLQSIGDSEVDICTVTLHVGIGTFRPIKAERLDDHEMHSEWCEISEKSVEQIRECREKGGRCVAVGTTSVRVLETAAASGTLEPFSGETDIFIREGAEFNAVDGLITNFHLPRSTLLILIRALGGSSLMKRAYEHAVEEEYRFFSYGDAMMIV